MRPALLSDKYAIHAYLLADAAAKGYQESLTLEAEGLAETNWTKPLSGFVYALASEVLYAILWLTLWPPCGSHYCHTTVTL